MQPGQAESASLGGRCGIEYPRSPPLHKPQGWATRRKDGPPAKPENLSNSGRTRGLNGFVVRSPAAVGSGLGGAFELGDVELFHFHHGLHGFGMLD